MTSGPLPTEPAGEPTGEGPTGRPAEAPRDRALAALRACGVEPAVADGAAIPVTSPIDGEEVAALEGASAADAIAAAARAATAFTEWRTAAPESRAAAVTAIAAALDRYAPELADLITIETGKPLTAARAEVGAAVDACASAATTAHEVAALPATASPAPPAAAFRVPMQTGRFAVRRPLGPVAVLGSAELPLLDWASAAPPALACGDPVVWLPGAPLV
ncbi:MAG: aldehyde dehydrogenase family protein, partial [Actinobacteria bacterium]|nr:aldehyde dehydrogenase family protein [Actinomycetota bacterium]